MPFYFEFCHFDRHKNSTDMILCLYKMKRTDWLLCLAKNCDWFKFRVSTYSRLMRGSVWYYKLSFWCYSSVHFECAHFRKQITSK